MRNELRIASTTIMTDSPEKLKLFMKEAQLLSDLSLTTYSTTYVGCIVVYIHYQLGIQPISNHHGDLRSFTKMPRQSS